jgi:hypothetical protein
MPTIYKGPSGGKYVLRANGEKLYIPLTATHWTKEGNRWRLHFSDKKSMLFPILK